MADRRPAGEYVASSMCFSALVFALVYSMQERWIDVAVLLLAGLGQVVAFLCFRNGYARGVSSLVILVAGMSAAEQLYIKISWWDLLVHFICMYVLVLIVWNLVLHRTPSRGALPTRRRILLCSGAGLVLAVVWELMELIGFLFVTPDIHIPMLDTLSDVAVGILGASLAGLHRKSL